MLQTFSKKRFDVPYLELCRRMLQEDTQAETMTLISLRNWKEMKVKAGDDAQLEQKARAANFIETLWKKARLQWKEREKQQDIDRTIEPSSQASFMERSTHQ